MPHVGTERLNFASHYSERPGFPPASGSPFCGAENALARRSVAFAIVVPLAWRPGVSLRAALLCLLPTSVRERGNRPGARRVGLLLGSGAGVGAPILPLRYFIDV